MVGHLSERWESQIKVPTLNQTEERVEPTSPTSQVSALTTEDSRNKGIHTQTPPRSRNSQLAQPQLSLLRGQLSTYMGSEPTGEIGGGMTNLRIPLGLQL